MSSLLNNVIYLIPAAIVLGLPGIAWQAWFRDKHDSLAGALIDATGISISLSALLALAAFLLGWPLPSWAIIGLYLAAGLLAGLGLFHLWRARQLNYTREASPGMVGNALAAPWWGGALLLLGFTFILAWRFYQIRELALPAWVDSVHHVLIVRVMLETGGVPQSLAPYLPVPFYYHFGFHALAAVFSFLSRLSPEQAVLIIGQVLNALVAVSVFRLGLALWDDWRRAGLAAILVGFVSQMPAYYVTWGRYTLLTGLVLLPLAMAVVVEIINKGGSPARVARLAVFSGGLLLAHYFAAILFALYLVFAGLHAWVRDWRDRQLLQGSRWLPLTLGAVGGALLAAPWIYRTWEYASAGVMVGAALSTSASDALYFPNYLSYLWRMAGPNRNYLLLGLAPLGLLVAGMRPKNRAFVAWAVTLILFSFPWGFYLAPFRPDHIVIVLFLPATLLVADFLMTAGETLQAGRFPRLGKLLLASAILSLLAWGVWDTRSILNRATVLATEADARAVQWIAGHTPTEARFYINTAFWQGVTYRGVDGGWWILPLTGRATLLPPVVYEWGTSDYTFAIRANAKQASSLEGCTPEFWELVRANGLTHVYLSGERGSLRPSAVQSCPGFQLLYAEQGVYIYALEP
jgi:hypothetical protein